MVGATLHRDYRRYGTKFICVESSGQSASDAASYKFSLLSFQFMINVIIMQFVLGYSRALSVALQAVECDLIATHDDARTVVRALEKLREGTRYQQLYDRAVQLASTLDVMPQKPRTTEKQTQRSNTGSTSMTISEYYRLNVSCHSLITCFNTLMNVFQKH